ncbi:predicted protein [Nematostella vectensis]|uniref:4-hydroxybenzoate polyprenyltransferase, mitochondrial n=2 Tax=Nematostella vectensis TaxID=45351 RepID=A7RFI6_NEMVE|nr:predicted protein [Nematostella vectensis]|eukprot:XP_001641670.1 predicted protein [Nematostella vectensis]
MLQLCTNSFQNDKRHNCVSTTRLFHSSNPSRHRSQSVQQRPPITAAEFVDSSPKAIQPYLKLARIDRPIGTWLLYLPCTWSIAMAAPPGVFPDMKMMALFGLGAVIMRGAGCTINDMWDCKYDKKVTRTLCRPLPSGEVSHLQALGFLAVQLSAGLAVLLSLNTYSILLGVASLGPVIVYPLMKRITYWPHIFLGITLNWGAMLGWSAIQGSCDWSVCLPLYLACVPWTIIYDTIYSHQDKSDDLAVGVKSAALLLGDQVKYWLSAFGAIMMTNMTIAGMACDQTWPYYTSLALAAAHLTWQIKTVDLSNDEDCFEKFKSNKWLGLLILTGIIGGGLLKEKKQDHHPSTEVLKKSKT